MRGPYSLLLCSAAVIAVIMASRKFGRYAGMLAAATCGAFVAWVMPPYFSFRVHSLADQFALALYGAISLVVVAKFPSRRRASDITEYTPCPAVHVRTHLSQVVGVVAQRVPTMESIEVSVADMTVASDPSHAAELLEKVFGEALAQRGIEKISVYGGRGPGVDRIWIAARYRSLPEEPYVLISGRRVEGDPLITSFDNGYERVYQISLPTASKPESLSGPA